MGICNPLHKLNKTFILNKDIKLLDIIKDNLFSYRYNGYLIYAHNLSSFDGIYILNQLVKLSEQINIKIEPMIRD